jgi:mRNA interferase HicA
MKRADLERALKDAGYWFLRHGGSHDVWTNGKRNETVPRHNEISENLARRILRRCEDGK